MNRKWLRLLSAWMCLVLVLGQVPAIADDPAADVSENVEVTSDAEIPEESSSDGAYEEPPVPPAETEVPPPVEEHTEAPVEPTEEPVAEPTAEPAEDIPQQPEQPETDGSETTDESLATPEPEAAPEPEITPEPEAPAPTLDELVAQWMSAMAAQGLSDDYHRALWLYDQLIANLAPGGAQDALSALTTLEASPTGYALAYAALLQAANIECMTLTDGASTWTLAKLDGAWTNIDVSADDDSEHYGTHFGLTDAALGRTPVWVGVLPSASDASLNYAVREQGYAAFVSSEELRALLAAAAENHAEELHLYNAGAAVELPALVGELLVEIDPYAESAVAQRDCYATVALRYGAEPKASIASIDAFTPIDNLPLEAPAVEAIVPAASSLTLGVKQSASVSNWTLLPPGAEADVSYSCAPAGVVTVDESGTVVAQKAGDAVVTLTAAEGVSCDITVKVAPAPSSVKIVVDRTTLGAGETLDLGYSIPSDSVGTVTFSLPKNQSIAELSEDGKTLIARNPGKVTLTAKTHNGKTASTTITVQKAPVDGALRITPATLKLAVGQTATLGEDKKATIRANYNSGYGGSMSWSAVGGEDGGAATIENGALTATSAGTVTVAATTYNGVTAACTVTIEPEPVAIELNETRTELGVGESVTLVPTAKNAQGEPVEKATLETFQFPFTCEPEGAVTVTAKGKVTAKNPGTATVTVTAYNGVTESRTFTIQAAPTKIAITNNPKTLGVKEPWTLEAQITAVVNKAEVPCAGAVTFKSSNANVLYVNPQTGVLDAKKAGSAKITATAFNKKAVSVTITVKAAPTGIKLDKTEVIMGVGEPNKQLKASFAKSAQYGHVEWSSDQEGIVSVEPDGKKDGVANLTAHATGTATITATVYQKDAEPLQATCAVTVLAAPTKDTMHLTLPKTTLGVGETLTAAFEYAEGTAGAYTFASSNKSFATVNSSTGVVKGVKATPEGTTVKIVAEAYNGIAVESDPITIVPGPTSVSLLNKVTKLGVGETWQLGAKVSAKVGKTTTDVTNQVAYSYKSSNDSLIHVDPATGELTAGELPAGRKSAAATITVTTYNKKSASVKITVYPAPTAFELGCAAASIGLGDSWQLTHTIDKGASTTVSYAVSGDAGAISIAADGTIAAEQLGKASVTARTHNGLEQTCEITVVPALTGIALSAPRTTVGVSEKIQLSAALTAGEAPFQGDVLALKYSSTNAKVASVSAQGLVTARAAGKATIRATAPNGVQGELEFVVKKAPTSVSISVDRTTLGVGETLDLVYKLSSGSEGTVAFSLPKDQSVAELDAEGKTLTALNPGKVKLTAKTHNGKTKTVTITVNPAPTAFELRRAAASIGLGDSWKLTHSFSPERTETSLVTYAVSGDAGAISIAADGTITAEQLGTATVTARTHNGLEQTCTITVVPAVTGIALSAPRTTVGVSEKTQLSAALMSGEEPFRGDVLALSYSSSNTKIATVDAQGLVNPRATGKVTITAKIPGTTYKSSVTFTVKKAPTSVSISVDRTVLGVDETLDLVCKLSSGSEGAVTFSLSPEGQSVVKLSEDGKSLTACSEGTVELTATTYNNKSSKPITIEVKAKPSSIEIASAPALLGVGDKAPISAAVNEGSAGKLYYRLADPNCATVSIDDAGLVTALAKGDAELVVYTYAEGVEAHTTLKVVPAPTSVRLCDASVNLSINLGVDDTYQITPRIDAGSATTFTYTRDNSNVTVSADGLVTAKRVGKSVVTVKTHNKLQAKLTVNVKKKPTSIKANPAAMTLGIGEKAQLEAKLSSGSATTLRFTNDEANPGVVSLSDAGEIEALREGVAEITLTTHNGLSATCTITVVPAPTAIALNVPERMGLKQTAEPACVLTPENSHTEPKYEIISGGEFLKIDSKGRLVANAKTKGKAKIRVTTHVEGVADEREIEIVDVPKSISFDQKNYWADLNGEYRPLQLLPTLEPAGTAAGLTYSIATKGYFTIDKDGWVTPIKAGKSKVTVKTHNGKTASTTIWVVEDPTVPQVITVTEPREPLEKGETFTPEVSVFPEIADAQLQWSSAKPDVAPVDPVTGEVTVVGSGRITITGQSQTNPSLKVSYKIAVLGGERCLVMPEHRIENYNSSMAYLIDANLKLIDKVKESAYAELDDLEASGKIKSSEHKSRKGYVDRAFEMYRFAWRPTPKIIAPYWKAANSEGGGKNFYWQNVYFGMPYTQTNRTNSKLSGSKASDGNYINVNLPTNRKYPGSDCSSFVSMAIWGFGSGRKSNNTTTIAHADYYSSPAWDALRPGDLLCKSGSHVVMFLYYTNAEKTQFVLIEQGGGGGDRYSNCVSTSVHNITDYKGHGYITRRPQ